MRARLCEATPRALRNTGVKQLITDPSHCCSMHRGGCFSARQGLLSTRHGVRGHYDVQAHKACAQWRAVEVEDPLVIINISLDFNYS